MISFNHVNIRVSDQEAVRDFLAAVIGLEIGPRPPFTFHGYWLYLGEVPVIHLAPREAPGEIGWVNHIAFSGYDFDRKTAELRAAGFPFRTQNLPASDIRQIFLDGPEGVRIELQCPPATAEEARSGNAATGTREQEARSGEAATGTKEI